MATFYTGQTPQAEEMYGLSRVTGVDAIQPFLEQVLDPMKIGSGIDLADYMQGVNITPGGIWGNQAGVDANTQAANTVLSRLYGARPDLFKAGFNPYANFADWNSRQNTRPGFNEGSSLGDFITGSVEHLGDTASELLQEPGVLALLAAGTGGALMGAGAAPAATGGTAAATDIAAGAAGAESVLGPATGTVLPAGTAASGATSFAAPGVAAPSISAVASGAGPFVPATFGTAAAGGLSNLLAPNGGSGAGSDLARLLGIAGITGLGMYGADRQADSLRDIAAAAEAKRSPFYNKSIEYLNNPEAYISGPGKASLDATLRALSARHGNPIGSPTALGIATEAGMRDWRDAVTGFGNMGLSGEDARMNLQGQATGADANVLNALGYGIGQATNPPTSLEQLIRSMRGGSLSLV